MSYARASQKNKKMRRERRNVVQSTYVQDALYGRPAEIVAAICHVDVATARRWKAGKTRMPYAAAALLACDLGALSKHWSNWIIRDEQIISPDGWSISRNDALAVPLLLGQIKALEAALAKYKEAEQLVEQPAPPEQLPSIIA